MVLKLRTLKRIRGTLLRQPTAAICRRQSLALPIPSHLKPPQPENLACTNTMQETVEATEALARRLEATGDYRILRRLVPRPKSVAPPACGSKTGIIVDFETTGLDTERDEILEVAMVKFSYSHDGQVLGVIDLFQAFQQPSNPITAEIVELTGITDTMVEGHTIDAGALESFVADVNVVIAHNAGFDRKFAERYWSAFQHKHWACSATGIAWKEYGFGGAKLEYLLAKSGLFHDAHRALDDCQATLEILARELPGKIDHLALDPT